VPAEAGLWPYLDGGRLPKSWLGVPDCASSRQRPRWRRHSRGSPQPWWATRQMPTPRPDGLAVGGDPAVDESPKGEGDLEKGANLGIAAARVLRELSYSTKLGSVVTA
jgi:hypothetical protein